jgi:hypothetical protein
MISVSWRICQSIFVADAFFCDRGVKNEFMAGGQHGSSSCGRGDGPVDLVLLWRFELGGGLMSRVADAKDLFIAV